MNIGTLEDVEKLRQALGDAEFRNAIQEARPGEFCDRSWHFRHLVLGVSEIGWQCSVRFRTLRSRD
jgi:hypothetical protein